MVASQFLHIDNILWKSPVSELVSQSTLEESASGFNISHLVELVVWLVILLQRQAAEVKHKKLLQLKGVPLLRLSENKS